MDALKEIVDYGVIGLLLLLGLVACGVAIERWTYFQRINLIPAMRVARLEIVQAIGERTA